MKTHVISRMRNINCNRLLSVFMVLLSLSALPARAVIRLAAPFGEHMVLQQGVPISIWGTGCPGGDEITVSVAGQSVTAKSDWAGRWMVQLAPMMAGGPYQLLVEVGRFKRLLPLHPTFWSGLALEDVLIGEVVLAPAQSGKTLAATKEGASEIASAKYPWIHMYTPPAQMVGDAPTEAAGKWTVTSPDTAGNFSATAYFLARELYNKLHVPIGVVYSSARSVCPPLHLRVVPDYCPAHQDRLRSVPSLLEAARKTRLRNSFHPLAQPLRATSPREPVDEVQAPGTLGLGADAGVVAPTQLPT